MFPTVGKQHKQPWKNNIENKIRKTIVKHDCASRHLWDQVCKTLLYNMPFMGSSL